MKNFHDFVNENASTMGKLIKTAERDGHLTGHEGMAEYVLSAAKKVAKEWDALNVEKQKMNRDEYYKKFLKLIRKIN